MRVLIVEDDYFKFSKISTVIAAAFRGVDFRHYDNVFGAINYLKSETPDAIVLDMSLPSHPAVAGQGSPVSMPAGGIEIILEIRRLRMSRIPILVLTQYPDVEVEYEYYSIEESGRVIKDLYGIENLKVVHYDNDSVQWVHQTERFLESL
ncbi:response regulator [Cupriavidus sp. HPC(L)]|uniref:response regulator n=1 Tax=Cupriavidus sp. HPC(L) TaxID=1217418 RepID=UPI0009F89D69|nr:response regulator [Cupriavidus sp. HPC(L)]